MRKWVTTRVTVSIADNQCGGSHPLCEGWIREGWEIMSVMTLPPTSQTQMCVAVVVLRGPEEHVELQNEIDRLKESCQKQSERFARIWKMLGGDKHEDYVPSEQLIEQLIEKAGGSP